METTGRDNESLDDTQGNVSDGDSRSSASGAAKPELVRVSKLAVVSCVLAIVSFLLLPGLVSIEGHKGGPSAFVRITYQYVVYGSSISAAVLGLTSLVRMGLGAGRLVGKGFASIGAVAPVVQWLIFFVLILLVGPTDVFIEMSCGTNLAGIGKAMLIYANDYEDELPRAGGRSSVWTGHIPDWTAPDRYTAYGINRIGGTGGQVSMSASLYLLVKYSEITPKRFICGGRSTSVFDGHMWTARTKEDLEEGITEFKVDTYRVPHKAPHLTDFWDFGPKPQQHISYAYHMPYALHALTMSSDPGLAIAADRNPWIDAPSAKAKDFSKFKPDIQPFGGTSDQARYGNTFRHREDGQNVLFMDGHVEFAKRAFCGLENDNIYTISGNKTGGDPLGTPPKLGSQPINRKDSLLVNDPPAP